MYLSKTWVVILLISLTFSCRENGVKVEQKLTLEFGGITRGDKTSKNIYLVFTGHEFAEGGREIINALKGNDIKASFFFTGDFYRNPEFNSLISQLKKEGHYLGAHSDKHLLYCPWEDRSKVLVTRKEFEKDVKDNYSAMKASGIEKENAPLFLPPYEWYNDTISEWTRNLGLQLVNFSSGTRSNADYTTLDMDNYIDNASIMESILDFEQSSESGLNGFILLLHIGVGPDRPDKFYNLLDDLIENLEQKKYTFKRIDKIF